MSKQIALKAIEHLNLAPLRRDVKVEDSSDSCLKIMAENGTVTLNESWLLMVEDWSEQDVGIEIIQLVKSLDNFENCTNIDVQAHGDFFYTLKLQYNEDDEEPQSVDVNFDSVCGITGFGNSFDDHIATYDDIKHSLISAVRQVENMIGELPSKGNTSSDCQKLNIQMTLSDLERKANGLTLMDCIKQER
ncbi:hypothetical protein [Vibrio crassostreae]|uniref:hypothetical protein n=1 Tax=Vibrio crassostreae TaxID=246167 RepID=UPI001B30E7CC|nr:hypothetical protein [Vibrio crassostreae]